MTCSRPHLASLAGAFGATAIITGCAGLAGLLGGPPSDSGQGPGPGGKPVLKGQALFPAALVKSSSEYRTQAFSLLQKPVVNAGVRVLKANGALVATASTDASGSFSVADVPPEEPVSVVVTYSRGDATYTEMGVTVMGATGSADASDSFVVDAASTAAIRLIQARAEVGTFFAVDLGAVRDLTNALAAALTDDQATSLIEDPRNSTLDETIAALIKVDPTIDAKLAKAAASITGVKPSVNLAGAWKRDADSNSIEQSGGHLTVFYLDGRGPFSGEFTGTESIRVNFADDPGCCTATVSVDRIDWSNGTVWKRKK